MTDRSAEAADRSESRRGEIFKLRYVYGMSPKEIAEQLSVPRSVIDDDLEAIKASLSNELGEIDPVQVMGVDLSVLDFIRCTAIRASEEAVDQNIRNEYLRTAIIATETMTQVRMAAYSLLGRYPDADDPEETEAVVEVAQQAREEAAADHPDLVEDEWEDGGREEPPFKKSRRPRPKPKK